MNESQFTRKICAGLQECGCLVFVAAGNKYGSNGWPDRHVITRSGEVFWLEFKAASGKLTALQTAILREINKRRPRTGFVVQMPGVLIYAGEACGEFVDARGLLKCLVL